MLGQILNDSNLGSFITSLIKENNIQSVLETGTMDGTGSTKVLYDALLSKPNPKLVSFEINPSYFSLAKKRYEFVEWVKIYNGSIVNFNNITTQKIDTVRLNDITTQKIDTVRQNWLDEDLKNYNSSSQYINLDDYSFDLCFLDSSEFCGFWEFKTIEKKTKYVILDDTKLLKHAYTLEYCLKNHECIRNFDGDRNGWACFKMKES